MNKPSVIIQSGVNKYKSKHIPGAEVWAFHQPGSVAAICRVAKAFGPEIIVEFGTGNGGLTLPLHEACPEAELHTFDAYSDPPESEYITTRQDQFTGGWLYRYPEELVKGPVPRAWFGKQVQFWVADTEAENNVIGALLRRPERTMLYCDGGNVGAEVGRWGPLLEPGELLGIHRWGQQFGEAQEQELLSGWTRHRWDEFESKGYMTRFWVRGETCVP